MIFIVGAIIVLSKVAFSRDPYPDGAHLINRLDEFFHFELHHYFFDSTADLSRWLPMSASHTALVNFKQRTVQTFSELSNNKNIAIWSTLIENANQNAFLIIVIDRLRIPWPLVLPKLVVDRVIKLKIGLFFVQSFTSLRDIEHFLVSKWSPECFHTFCAFYLDTGDGNSSSFNVFKLNPFGTFRIINMTDVSLQDYFPVKVPNHYGQRFLSYVMGSSLDAIEAQFWPTLLSVFNATMPTGMRRTELSVNHNFDTIDEDLFILAYPDNHLSEYPVYPHRQTVRLMIVPHAQPYSDFMTYLKNGTWAQIFLFAFIVIVTSSLLLIVSRHLHREKKILPLECVADVFNLLINDNAGIKYGNLHWADISIIIPLTFTGLVVMNGVVSLLQSYLTSPIYQRQINTIEELYTSSVPILSIDYTKRFYIQIMENMTNYGGWNNKIHVEMKLRDKIETYNNSIAFFVREDIAQSLMEVQKRLGLEVYHVLKDASFAKYVTSYHMYPAFPFMEQMTDVILRLNDGGLFDKWTKDDIEIQTQDLWKRKSDLQLTFGNESDVNDFSVPTIVWCGWIGSVILFVCEIIWNGMSRRKFTKCSRRRRK